MEEGTKVVQKRHHAKHSGPKAEKKKNKTKIEEIQTARQRNPKAFAIQSVNKTARAVRRTADIKEKKHHIPVVDRTPLEPPPVVVAVVGPPKVGKTTLVKCLIKNFTQQKLATINGPVTLVSGKKRRLTIIECNNDISSMIDVAKVADLVLLLVDASFGFEMETFEFLNIAQSHGFPKIMGVLTHLDLMKNNKTMTKTKKRLKHRFWKEVYQGAKLFYLSGMLHGEYLRREIINLGRFISVMKFRPLVWRTSHPYILADRMEDLTSPEDIRQKAKCDRYISLYGFVRGTPLKLGSSIHLSGCGDFGIKDITFLPDPCPLPDKNKKRSLNTRERLIYAPMSGLGGIVYDKDVVYVELGTNNPKRPMEEETNPVSELVTNLIGTQHTLDSKMATSKMSLFQGASPIPPEGLEEADNSTSRAENQREERIEVDGRIRRRVRFNEEAENTDQESSSDEEEDEGFEDTGDGQREAAPPGRADDGELVISSAKRKKVDLSEVQFADSDDELEMEENSLAANGPEKGRTKMRRGGLKERESSSEEESDDSKEDNSDDEDGDDDQDENSDEDGEEAEDDEMSDSSSGNDDDSFQRSRRKRKHQHEAAGEELDDEEGTSDEESLHSHERRTNLKTQTSEEIQAELFGGDKQKRECSDGKLIEEEDFDDSEDENEEQEDGEEENDVEGMDDENQVSDEKEKTGGQLNWKENLAEKASAAFVRQQLNTPNLRKLVYGQVAEMESEDEDGEEFGGLLRVTRTSQSVKKLMQGKDGLDCSNFPVEHIREWDLQEIRELISDCFVTGKWEANEDAEARLEKDDEVYGDFEDLETGEIHKGKDEDNGSNDNSDDDDVGGGDGDEAGEDDEDKKELSVQEKDKLEREQRMEKKRKTKKRFLLEEEEGPSFFEEWRDEVDEQAKLNRAEFQDMSDEIRTQYEGFRPGMYVRVEIANVPCEFVEHFDPTCPMLLGGLLSSENTIGFVQIRLKKHRWYSKILKTRDPLIFSVGWRRFQTIPLYCMQDHNGRNRLLKYTPEHLHCVATIWGPITPQGTGILAVQSIAGRDPGFRIAATGVILDLDKSINIVKKLKLTGTPLKIHKNTAFIQGMFNSSIEVSKYEGALIRTVSGIRGQIKKPSKAPPGAFRASFEDKILLSDIVFLRSWYPVQIPKFYNPVTTMLLPKEKKGTWSGMRTVGQIRWESNVPTPVNTDSLYKPIERRERKFNRFIVPRKLAKDLPFKYQPKQRQRKEGLTIAGTRAVIREPHERKVAALMEELGELYKERKKKEKMAKQKRDLENKKKMKVAEEMMNMRQKRDKKEMFRLMGDMKKRKKNPML